MTGKLTRRVSPFVRIATRRLASSMAPEDSASTKRKSSRASISPPPTKRRVQSATTKGAVASFFTPASQKPKDNTKWTERGSDDEVAATLLVAKYEPEGFDGQSSERRKVAAFDMDGTLITTSSGKKFSKEATDWKWWTPEVVPKLKELHDQNYQIVIFSNQAGLTLHADPNSKGPKAKTDRVPSFKQKCSAVLSQLDLPVTLYAATGKDIFRKPRPGMWHEFCTDYGVDAATLDLENSVFVGDAGGRTAVVVGSSKKATAKDFSCSDRNFAHNVGLRFVTPEEFFLGEGPRDFVRDFALDDHPFPESKGDGEAAVLFEKKHDTEMIIFCGPPGGGKSTFYWKHLKPLGYERINQDILKTRDKCVAAAGRHLEAGESVAIDNTNADPTTRGIWVALAKKHNVPIRCLWFKTPLTIAQHNDAVRSLNKIMNPESRTALPTIAFTGFNSRFKEPQEKEGFEVIPMEFRFSGTQDEHKVWAKYWS